MIMKQSELMHSSLPDDIALEIASSLQVRDVCALSSCCRFWRQLCGSDDIWESLARERWPFLTLVNGESASSLTAEVEQNAKALPKRWRQLYAEQHIQMAGRAATVVKSVEQFVLSNSLEVGAYLHAIEDLRAMKLGFKDVEMFLFNPKLNVLLNLIGLHYCINWLKVPGEHVVDALRNCKVSERRVCVKWWKLGRWFYGFRMRDEAHYRLVSLIDLAMARDEQVLGVLLRGAIYEVLRVQISAADSTSNFNFQ